MSTPTSNSPGLSASATEALMSACRSGELTTLRLGDPLLPTTDVGPMVNAVQRDKVIAQLDALLGPHDDVAQWFLQILCRQFDRTFDVAPRCQTSDDLINEEWHLIDHLVDLLLIHDLRDQNADHTQYNPPKDCCKHAPLFKKDDTATDGQHQQAVLFQPLAEFGGSAQRGLDGEDQNVRIDRIADQF